MKGGSARPVGTSRAHSSCPRLGRRSRAIQALAGLTTLTLVLGVSASAGTAAWAAWCDRMYSPYPGTCIGVWTGAKNSSNHTQWVDHMTVSAPRAAAPSKLEAWAGNGPTGVAWYRSTSRSVFVTWPIHKWIKTNSGICGAYTYRDGSGRSIACIKIKA